MRQAVICSLLAFGFVITTTAQVDAAKPRKQESDVQKALKQVYPDAETEITGTTEINGVKVYDVQVKTKMGQSTAQITDYGDFLMYGVPHEYGSIRAAIRNNVSGIFKSSPENIEMYRVTHYYVDFKNPNGKTFTGKFDAVGRLIDVTHEPISQDAAVTAAATDRRGKRITDDDVVNRAVRYAKRELGDDVEIEAVYPAGQEGNEFLNVQLKGGGELIVNEQGQVLSVRVPITKDEFPQPVATTIQSLFAVPIEKLWRAEDEYYQFNQESQTGQPIVVKMRPNGDILDVTNLAAEQEEQALQAKSKQRGEGRRESD